MTAATDRLLILTIALALTGASVGGAAVAFEDGDTPIQTTSSPRVDADAGSEDGVNRSLEPTTLNASATSTSSYEPANGVPGTFVYEAQAEGLPTLPDGLAYQGWLVRGTPLTGRLDAMGLDTYNHTGGKSWELVWTDSDNHRDRLVTGVTVEPENPDGVVRLVMLRGQVDPATGEATMDPVGPFEDVVAQLASTGPGLELSAENLPGFTAIAYGAWLVDEDRSLAERLGVTGENTTEHAWTVEGLAGADRVEITVETPGTSPGEPSGLVVASAPLD